MPVAQFPDPLTNKDCPDGREGVESTLELVMPENMQKIVDLLTELWNTGKPELAMQLYSDQAERTDPNQLDPARGAQQIANYVAQVHTGFPDFKLEIKQRISEGDQIVTEWTCTGTHRGEFQGIPPTGRRVEITGMTLGRIKGSQIVEERVYFDRLAMLQQLGVVSGTEQSEAKTAARY